MLLKRSHINYLYALSAIHARIGAYATTSRVGFGAHAQSATVAPTANSSLATVVAAPPVRMVAHVAATKEASTVPVIQRMLAPCAKGR